MADTAIAAGRVPAPAAPAAPPRRLDDLMMAMDVVDTLRHNELIALREIGQGDRDAELKTRLRQIYESQGIAVTDRALDQGIAALKERRFAYTPPPPGLRRALATLYVRRGRYGRVVAIGALVLGLGVAGYQFGVVAPRERAETAARVELQDTLPRALDAARAAALGEARVDAARARAEALHRDGQAALARNDPTAARRALADLQALGGQLRQEYTLRIVSRPGELSAVFREPQVNRRARNHYAIVEAVAPDGSLVTQPIRSEEDGEVRNVSRFGVRVPESTFNDIARDKRDDGIVQRNQLGVKRRGALDVEYLLPAQGGFITQW